MCYCGPTPGAFQKGAKIEDDITLVVIKITD
jgi:serine phosphatase RsbU (regulator of sigma subunit)